MPLGAQTSPPIDAGTLLEQQRRLEAPAMPKAEPDVLKLDPVPLPAGADGDAQTTVRRFEVQGDTLVDVAAVQAALAPWLGRPVGLPDLRRATAAVETLYRERGWLARVSLPAQDITDGTVQLLVTESRIGRVLLQQGPTPVRASLAARVQLLLERALPVGQPLSLTALERALSIADDIPGVRVAGSLGASETPGGTDVIVNLSPREPYRGEAYFDNGGNRATGSERVSANIGLLSPLGLGEQFNLGTSLSRGSQYLSFAASAPLPGSPGYQGWRMTGSASVLRYKVLNARNTTTGLPPEGGSNAVGAGLQYPLVNTAVANWTLFAGVNQTRLVNRDDNQTLGTLDTTGRARSRALSLSLSGRQFDRWAGGGANAAVLALTSGRLDLDGSPAYAIAGDAQNADTQGHFQKLRWNASRLQSLGTRLSLLGAASGQFASGNLDPSEKFYLGGMSGVRAYPNAEAGGSTGTLLTLELRQEIAPQWQASLFYDRGQVQLYRNNRGSNGNPLVANNNVTLQGAGLALAWRAGAGQQIKATWARRMGSNPLATASGNDSDGSLRKNRIWLEASLAF